MWAAASGRLWDIRTTSSKMASLVAFKRQGIDPNQVAAVLVSHLHVDHYGGLPQRILDGQFNRCEAPLTIAGPAGTADLAQLWR
jgi:ribonuclease BN (tRNA processing enzyme)